MTAVPLFVPVGSARLRLEPIRADHAGAMFEGLCDPRLYRYQTDEPPADREQLRARYARLASGRSPSEDRYWLNWIVVPHGEPAAGYVQATIGRDVRTATIGYLVLPAFQHRGIGGEAVAAMVRHLTEAGVRTFHAVIDVRNLASIALVERLGFRRRATRRSDDVIEGVRGWDHEYELTNLAPMSEKRATHDSGTPEALLRFMVSGWATPPGAAASPVEGVERFAARRDALARAFPGETLVVPTGHEKTRANDTTYRFRPGSDFYYLTGNLEPDNVLVLASGSQGHTATLYCEPNPGKTDATFFTDRVKGELWVGPRLGLPQTARRYGIATKPLAELEADLAALCAHGPFRALRGIDPMLDASLPAQTDRDAAFATALSEFRLIKDELEVRELRRAIEATHHAFEDVVRALPQAETERTIEGVFNLRARIEGNDTGYSTIAASGPNACTLHWTRNDRRIGEHELLLVDAGVEAESLYTADITRTLPISGRFTPEQRAIYELVLAAQDAAFARCAAGNDFLDPNRAAMRVLAEGLERLGILASAADALREENQFYRRYSLHNVSHMLGLDVHDCAAARAETYKFGTLRAGMVLTVEPGLYFQLDDLTVPARYRGIGVRIEDDVLITETGVEVLSAAIPRETAAVEAWVSSALADSPAGAHRPSR